MADRKLRALLLSPEFSPECWGTEYGFRFIGGKAPLPPLGLLTIAAFFPVHVEVRIVDLNVEHLSDDSIAWADYVFISAMISQKDSFKLVVERCKKQGKTVVAGGAYPTACYDEIEQVDHLVLGEAENNFMRFLSDLEAGLAEAIYLPDDKQVRPDLSFSPAPRYELIRMSHYNSMSIQFSRGCPFDCEYCSAIALYGRTPRTKSPDQILGELELLNKQGWRDSVFFVDDNFLCHQGKTMELLRAVAEWQRQHNYPFCFYTQASINLASNPELMAAMVEAGFDMVFIGLESPNPKALMQIKKRQNVNSSDPDFLFNAVRTIQGHGMEVAAGFILGLDGDDPSVFDALIRFMQRAGIPTVLIGLLTAIKGTSLYARLQEEKRLLTEPCCPDMAPLNFVPHIKRDLLVKEYRRVLRTAYDPYLRNYFERCARFLAARGCRRVARRLGLKEARLMMLLLFVQLFSVKRWALLRFMLKVVLRAPGDLPDAARLAIAGCYQERAVSRQIRQALFRDERPRGRKWGDRWRQQRASHSVARGAISKTGGQCPN